MNGCDLVVKTWARGQCDIIKYRVPRASVHVLTSIASIANALYIIKLLNNSTVSMVTGAILDKTRTLGQCVM